MLKYNADEHERKRARGDGPNRPSQVIGSSASCKVKIQTEPLFNYSSSGSDARATSVADLMEHVTNFDPEGEQAAAFHLLVGQPELTMQPVTAG